MYGGEALASSITRTTQKHRQSVRSLAALPALREWIVSRHAGPVVLPVWRTKRNDFAFAPKACDHRRRSDTALPRINRLAALFRIHSSSSPSSSFGAGPFLAVPSLAAMRFSITRWRISANIAGFSLTNAFAFSRPWPMRVVL